jgi:hypothetical protein
MKKGTYDVFDMVVNFILENWESKHVIIGLFEPSNTIGTIMAFQL